MNRGGEQQLHCTKYLYLSAQKPTPHILDEKKTRGKQLLEKKCYSFYRQSLAEFISFISALLIPVCVSGSHTVEGSIVQPKAGRIASTCTFSQIYTCSIAHQTWISSGDFVRRIRLNRDISMEQNDRLFDVGIRFCGLNVAATVFQSLNDGKSICQVHILIYTTHPFSPMCDLITTTLIIIQIARTHNHTKFTPLLF